MSDSTNDDSKEMERAVNVEEERRDRWRQEGELTIWQNLSMIGSLGWLIITPTLLGVVLGRWLDNRFDSGIFFSGALIFIGVALGCRLAWQHMNKDSST